jgi:hypothetical protein
LSAVVVVVAQSAATTLLPVVVALGDLLLGTSKLNQEQLIRLR